MSPVHTSRPRRGLPRRWTAPITSVAVVLAAGVTALTWQPTPAYAEDTAFYVSADGDDTNPGTSPERPWRTLDKVNATTFAPGDRILLRSGDSWTGQLWPKGSGSDGQPITIDRYGTGAKPRLAGEGKVGEAVRLYNQEYWQIRNLDVSNAAPVGQTPGAHLSDLRGIGVHGDNGQILDQFVIDSVDVHDVTGEIRWIGGNPADNSPGVTWGTGWDRSKNTGGIAFLTSVPDIAAPGGPTVLNGITVQNSTIRNTSFANITIKQYTGDAPGAVATGWGTRRTADDTRFTPHTNVTIRGNYLSQADADFGGNGVYLTNVRGALVEGNLLDRVGVSGIETYAADQVTVQYNEISGTRHTQGSADANGFDPDIATTNQLFQYNYLHDNGDGILLCGCGSARFGSAVVRYNVVTGSQRWNLHVSQGTGTVADVYHNTFYSTQAPNMVSGSASGQISVRNNLFVSTRPVSFLQNANVTYHNNGYAYGITAPAGDTAAVVGDPLLVNPGVSGPHGEPGSGPRLDTARGFALTAGSAFIDTAAAMADRGGRDFIGTPVPVGAAADVGAFEYTTPPGQTTETVSGFIRNQYGVAVAGATVTVTASGTPLSTTSAQDGFYRIPGVTFASDAQITAMASQHQTYTSTVAVASGNSTRHDIELTSLVTTGTLTGTVVDERATPIPGATVTVTCAGATVATGRTGADGMFTIGGVAAGTNYSITASIDGYTGIPRTGITLTPTATIAVGVLYLRSPTSDTHVADSFDQTPTGPLADGANGWRVVPTGNAIDVVDVPSTTDKSVRLNRTTGQGGNDGTNLAQVFTTPLTGLVTIESHVMRNDTQGGWYSVPYIYNTAGTQAISVAFARGEIIAYNGGASRAVGRYTSGQWYRITVTVDTLNQRFHLDIDGTRILTDATFRNPMPAIGKIAWYANAAERGSLHVDNVRVAQGVKYRATQTITFATPASRTFSSAPFTLDAVASSGLPVQYTATGACAVSEATLTLTAAGSCTITASQTGNDNYLAAAPVIRTFTVRPYTLHGFHHPVRIGTTTIVKAGSTVPLKFEILRDRTELTDTAEVTSITVTKPDGTSEPLSLRSLWYDHRDGQFRYDWKTTKAKGTHRVTVTTRDGSTITAQFWLR